MLYDCINFEYWLHTPVTRTFCLNYLAHAFFRKGGMPPASASLDTHSHIIKHPGSKQGLKMSYKSQTKKDMPKSAKIG